MQLSRQYKEWIESTFARADAEVQQLWGMHDYGGVAERRLLGGAMTRAQSLQSMFLRSVNQVKVELAKQRETLLTVRAQQADENQELERKRLDHREAERTLGDITNAETGTLRQARDRLTTLRNAPAVVPVRLPTEQADSDIIRVLESDTEDEEEAPRADIIANVQAQIESYEEQVANHRETLATLLQEIQTLQTKAANTTAEATHCQNEIARLEALENSLPQAFNVFEPWDMPQALAQQLHQEFSQTLWDRMLTKSDAVNAANPTIHESRRIEQAVVIPPRQNRSNYNQRRAFTATQHKLELFDDISIEICGIQQGINAIFNPFFADACNLNKDGATAIMTEFQLRHYRALLRDAVQKVLQLPYHAFTNEAHRADVLALLRDVDDLIYFKALELAAAEPAQKPSKFTHFDEILAAVDEDGKRLVQIAELAILGSDRFKQKIKDLDIDYKQQERKDSVNDPIIIKSKIYTILYLDNLLREGIDYHRGDPQAKLRDLEVRAKSVLFSQRQEQAVGQSYDKLDQAKYELMTAWFYYARDLIASRGLADHKGMWHPSVQANREEQPLEQDPRASFLEFKLLISGYATNTVGKYEQKLLIDRTVTSILLWIVDGVCVGTAYVGGMSLATGYSMEYIMTKAKTMQIFDFMAHLDESQQGLVLCFLSLGILAVIGIECLHANAMEPALQATAKANRENSSFASRLEAELAPLLFHAPAER